MNKTITLKLLGNVEVMPSKLDDFDYLLYIDNQRYIISKTGRTKTVRGKTLIEVQYLVFNDDLASANFKSDHAFHINPQSEKLWKPYKVADRTPITIEDIQSQLQF